MRIAVILVSAGLGLTATPALASEDLAKKHACIACHQVDAKGIGPSYREMAKKYGGQKDIEARLLDKVKKGGQGNWGQMPMPPQAHVPEGDLKAMIKWILSRK